jgi:dethiobiotin synthetase
MTARVLLITGTDIGVGKTITTAALTAAITAGPAARPGRGQAAPSIAVDKPVQTGVRPGEPGDSDEVRRLAGISSATEGIRLRLPMAPVAAADHEAAILPTVDEHAARIRRLSLEHDHVLVEGTGGLLVELDRTRRTLADLAGLLGENAAVVVVCRSGLGALNHTTLTLEALQRRGLAIAGIVIGSWPRRPGDIELDNRRHLSSLGVPLLGAIPEGASWLPPGIFRGSATIWFSRLP